MKYKAKYPNQADFEAAVSENHRDLFEQRGDEFIFIGVEGLKTDADVTKLQTAIAKEREEHKTTKGQLKAVVGERTAEETIELLDSIPELKASVESAKKPDDERINNLVEARIKSRLTPVERERDALKTRVSESATQLAQYASADRARSIQAAVVVAARGGKDGKGPKVLPTAEEDALLLAERVMQINDDGTVTTKDGVDPIGWLYEIAPSKPHWFEASQGGGGRGSGPAGGANFGDNPWTKKHWNITEQMKVTRLDRKRAEQMASAAGSKIGATSPPEK